ncbi:MAG: XRE family transcriptional regulator [Sulfurovum sp.]|nr:XRE family transcriptional regulator [Sulfurovum sp.]
MKYNEFKNYLNKSGLSINEFAYLIKANPKSITNLACKDKEYDVPKHLSVIATLMAEMSMHGIDFKGPLEELSIHHQKCRIKGKFGGDKQGVLEL